MAVPYYYYLFIKAEPRGEESVPESKSSNFVLLGTILEDEAAFALLEINKESKFVARGDTFESTTLKEVHQDYAVIERNGRESILKLKKADSSFPALAAEEGKPRSNRVAVASIMPHSRTTQTSEQIAPARASTEPPSPFVGQSLQPQATAGPHRFSAARSRVPQAPQLITTIDPETGEILSQRIKRR